MESLTCSAGVFDRRNGRAPSFNGDEFISDANAMVSYERGRMWACLAPRTMKLRAGKS